MLKSFLSNKCIVEAAVEAIIKLVSPSAKSYGLSDLFDTVLEEANERRMFYTFKSRRFGKFGIQAAAILHHRRHLLETIRRAGSRNLLVQAAEIYLTNPLVLVALEVFGKFTQKVTFPFLNFCSKADQGACVRLMPGKRQLNDEKEREWEHHFGNVRRLLVKIIS